MENDIRPKIIYWGLWIISSSKKKIRKRKIIIGRKKSKWSMKNLDSKMNKNKGGKIKTQKIKIKIFLKIKSFQNILWIKNLEHNKERKKNNY